MPAKPDVNQRPRFFRFPSVGVHALACPRIHMPTQAWAWRLFACANGRKRYRGGLRRLLPGAGAGEFAQSLFSRGFAVDNLVAALYDKCLNTSYERIGAAGAVHCGRRRAGLARADREGSGAALIAAAGFRGARVLLFRAALFTSPAPHHGRFEPPEERTQSRTTLHWLATIELSASVIGEVPA